MKKTLLLLIPIFLILGATVVAACNYTPQPTSTPTPTVSPSETPTPTETPIETVISSETPEATPTPSEEPTATPEPTSQPTVAFSDPSPAYAPTQAACPLIEDWLPQITFQGNKTTHNTDGTWTFHYTIKSVSEQNPVWWVWYGPTPVSLPQVKIVYGTEAEITQQWSTNWIRAAIYREPGCFGTFSQVIN